MHEGSDIYTVKSASANNFNAIEQILVRAIRIIMTGYFEEQYALF